MRSPRFYQMVALVCCAGLSWCVGCTGSKKVLVQGRLLYNGNPLVVSSRAILDVTFIPQDEANRARNYPVNVNNADATFFLPDMPKGTYKVAVQLQDPAPSADKFKEMFSAKQTQILRTVDGKTPLEIDLAKPTG